MTEKLAKIAAIITVPCLLLAASAGATAPPLEAVPAGASRPAAAPLTIPLDGGPEVQPLVGAGALRQLLGFGESNGGATALSLPSSVATEAQRVMDGNPSSDGEIGIKHFKFNATFKGTLFGAFDRWWLSTDVTTKDKVKVTVTKSGGKGEASATAYLITKKDGDIVEVDSHNFHWQPGNSDLEVHKDHTFNNAKHCVVAVFMNGQSVGKRFKYYVIANQLNN